MMKQLHLRNALTVLCQVEVFLWAHIVIPSSLPGWKEYQWDGESHKVLFVSLPYLHSLFIFSVTSVVKMIKRGVIPFNRISVDRDWKWEPIQKWEGSRTSVCLMMRGVTIRDGHNTNKAKNKITTKYETIIDRFRLPGDINNHETRRQRREPRRGRYHSIHTSLLGMWHVWKAIPSRQTDQPLPRVPATFVGTLRFGKGKAHDDTRIVVARSRSSK